MSIEATTSDPTARACQRLFDLMAREPANQRHATYDAHARMMAAYAAMFGPTPEELDA